MQKVIVVFAIPDYVDWLEDHLDKDFAKCHKDAMAIRDGGSQPIFPHVRKDFSQTLVSNSRPLFEKDILLLRWAPAAGIGARVGPEDERQCHQLFHGRV
jgi:hypothetical protein